jgi:hypothetical protein
MGLANVTRALKQQGLWNQTLLIFAAGMRLRFPLSYDLCIPEHQL